MPKQGWGRWFRCERVYLWRGARDTTQLSSGKRRLRVKEASDERAGGSPNVSGVRREL